MTDIRYEKHGRVRLITIDRPAKMNSLDFDANDRLVQAWRVRLDSVRVGDVVVYGVEGVVSAGSMPMVLLGNTFLSHFQMTRTNDQMVLDKRF